MPQWQAPPYPTPASGCSLTGPANASDLGSGAQAGRRCVGEAWRAGQDMRGGHRRAPTIVRAICRLALEDRPLIPVGAPSAATLRSARLIAQGEDVPTVAGQMRHA